MQLSIPLPIFEIQAFNTGFHQCFQILGPETKSLCAIPKCSTKMCHGLKPDILQWGSSSQDPESITFSLLPSCQVKIWNTRKVNWSLIELAANRMPEQCDHQSAIAPFMLVTHSTLFSLASGPEWPTAKLQLCCSEDLRPKLLPICCPSFQVSALKPEETSGTVL